MGQRLIRVGTRASALARAQTTAVVALLQEHYPNMQVEVVPITTGGDLSQSSNQTTPDWGSGVFVKEIEAALLREDVDVAVHSLKDVPPLMVAGLTLAAVPVRDDPSDVLVTIEGRGLEDLAPGARIGTSSARRVAFLRNARPDIQWKPVRGNVETRLRKMAEGQYEGLVLARAGLLRLDLDAAYVVLDPEVLPPAPGQGALGIQCRAGDREVLDLLEPLHDPATGAAVRAERRLMTLLEGGCRLPVGALGSPTADGHLGLLGGLVTDQERIAIDRADGTLAEPEQLAEQLATILRAEVAPRPRVHA